MNDLSNILKYGFNRGNLKMIALFCMTLDHIGVAIFEPWLKLQEQGSMKHAMIMVSLLLLRFIGRLAFPIFCFFIVEGFSHTRNIYRYSLRLLVLAFISEVPFDMVLKHKFVSFEFQNVFWTLLTGLLVVYCMDGIREKFHLKEWIKIFLCALICAAGLFVGECFKTDYGGYGVLTIAVIYLVGKGQYLFSAIIAFVFHLSMFIYEKDFSMQIIAMNILFLIIVFTAIFFSYRIENINSRKMFAGCVVLCVMNPFEVSAFANLALTELFNGEKGKHSGWFFYFYYPAHFALLAGFSMLFGLY